VDLHESERFRALDTELLSISPDSLESWAEWVDAYGVETPVLSDADNRVANAYGVMRWGMPTGEPGHTFVLVDHEGRVRWIQDYGAPENGGLMYVEPQELTEEMARRLQG
jgi:peroxiredoxin